MYNDLNYRLLRSFSVRADDRVQSTDDRVQSTDDRVQMTITVCRDTAAVSVNAKMTSWMFRTRHAVSLLGGTEFADD